MQEYPFVLDPFQREALRCIESNQSVLVSAHTSAGKTVVAEYAIAISLRDTQRVIYTTPIKVGSKPHPLNHTHEATYSRCGDAVTTPAHYYTNSYIVNTIT